LLDHYYNAYFERKERNLKLKVEKSGKRKRGLDSIVARGGVSVPPGRVVEEKD